MAKLSCKSWPVMVLLVVAAGSKAYGVALDFDGVDDYVEMGTMSFSLPLTVELWFKTDSINSKYDGLLFWASQSSPFDGIDIYCYGDGRIAVRMAWDGEDWVGGSGIVGDNTWHHIAASRGLDNVVNVYIDGVFAGSKSVTKGIGTSHTLRVGRADVTSTSFNGLIAGVRIWNTVRSATEIAADASPCAVFTGAEPDLIGSWDLDEGSGQVAEDSTVGNHDSTLGSSGGVDTSDPAWVSDTPCTGGSLHTLIEPPEVIAAGAQWRRTGTTTWFNSGDTESGISLGQQSVEFKPVPGWSVTNQTVAITAGVTSECTGTYAYVGNGSLQVTIEPVEAANSGAQWRRLGTTTWFNGGYNETDIPAFDYEIEFNSVSGWASPEDFVVTVSPGTTASATANYTAWGGLTVTIAPAEVVNDGAQWRRTGTETWFNSGETETGVPPGDYAIEFKPVLGWLVPASRTVSVSPGLTTTNTAIYTESRGPNSIPDQDNWVTNGAVFSITTTPGTIYIGGDFTRIMPFTGTGVAIDTTTGTIPSSFPKINGTIRTCVPDGTGGWFIGGEFTKIGTVTRNYIAHILADGSLDLGWNANASSSVYALALSKDGSTLYAGGFFGSIGGQSRSCLAALSTSTGTATSWNPGGYAIFSLALSEDGSTVYVGGDFYSIGGQSRRCLAALDTSTGNTTAWNPNPNNQVRVLAVNGSTVYAGGYFSSVGGQTRNYLVAIDATTGSVTSWNPNPNANVWALAVTGTTVFAGGDFSSIGGQIRSYVAALDASLDANNATAWNPGANNGVYSLAVAGSTLYAGGFFTTIGGQPRNNIAALDTTTGTPTSWDPNAGAGVRTLAVQGTKIYVGGEFYNICGLNRNRVAAFDAGTGVPTDWDPNANGTVRVLKVSGTNVYAGGNFTIIGGQARNKIAALGTTTGTATTWNPNAGTGIVNTLTLSGSLVYVGGAFGAIGGKSGLGNLAAIDVTTGLATTWNPNAFGGQVNILTASEDGNTIYAGGEFSEVKSLTRSRLAAIDAVTGIPTAWNPSPNISVTSMKLHGSTLFIGGSFTQVGGQTREGIAAIDTATGLATSWDADAGSSYGIPRFNALTLSSDGATLYSGGLFTGIGTESRSSLAAIDTSLGLATSWNPNISGGFFPQIICLAVSGSTVYAGGEFRTVGGQSRPNFAKFIPSTAPSSPAATNIGIDTITWTWQDNSEDETGFQVYADPGYGTPLTLRGTTPADAISFQHNGLSANTQYAFQVSAINGPDEIGRSGVRTSYTLVEPVEGLVFSDTGTTSISVASLNTLSNLAGGSSGLFFSNNGSGTNSGWQKNNAPWVCTGLHPNTEYIFSGISRNGESVVTFPFSSGKFTLAAIPTAPAVSIPSLHSVGVDALDVEIASGDGNPLNTVYAIQVSPDVNGNAWVQADGTVGIFPVFRMAAAWDTRRVSGLAKNTEYTFTVVARNGENVDTAPGPGTKASTYPNVTPSTPAVTLPEVQSDIANLISAISIASYDPDGDPVRYDFDWYVKRSGSSDFVLFTDGTPLPVMTSQINSTDTEPGDTWFCVVTPYDMEEAGIPVQTNECSIVLGGVIPSFISYGLTPLEVTLGESVVMLGQIFPTPTGSGTVAFDSVPPSGIPLVNYPEGTVFSGGTYSKLFYPNEASEGRAAWSLTATWPGDATYQSATSTPVSLTVLKAQPELALTLSHNSALLNLAGAEDFEVAPALSVPGFPMELQSLLSGRVVRLSVQTPDGQTPWAPLEAVTDASGVAHFDKAAFDAAGVTFNEAGVWRFRAAFDGNANLRSTVTDDFGATMARLTIKEGAGYVILALGRLDAFAEGHAEHGQTTDYIYSVLRGRGFVDDDIQYLREFLPGEIDRGFPVDGPATAASLQYAIETWARDKMLASPAPLYVVLVDHGNPGIFYTDIGATGPVEFITAEDLNGWLSVLQSALGQTKADRHCERSEAISAMDVSQIASSQAPRNDGITYDKATAAEQDITVIYGACYSGSFIPVLSGPKRVIITSSAANEIAYRGVINDDTGLRDGDFFLTEFFRNAGEGRTLKEAFELACVKTSEYTATRTGSNAVVPQHPLLDDNADGVGTTGYLSPTPGLDGALAAVMDLGLGANAGNGVGWFTAMPPVTLSPGGTLPDGLWAEATGRALLPGDTAWLEIKTPAYNDGTVATAGYEAFQRVASLVGPIHVTATPEDLGGGRTRFSWSQADLTAQLTEGFATPGTYKAYYFLRDGLSGQVGAYLVTNIYVSQTGNQPPAAVDLLYPDNDGTVNASFFLAWTESIDPNADPVTYRVEISEDPLFPEGATIVRDGLTETVVTLSAADGILNDHDYYWRVIPTDPYGATPEDNDTRRFLVRGSPGVPGAITGKVTVEGTTVGVNGAILTLTPTAVQAATLPPNGAYFLEASQGVYNLSVSAPGYQTEQVNGVIVTSGRYTTLYVALEPEAVNHVPLWTPIGDKWVVANRTLSFQVAATDIDAGQTLTYSVSGLPTGATFDPATRTFTWTPSTSQVRTEPYSITFTATDNGEPPLAAASTIDITVDRGAYISGPGMAVIGDQVELEFHGEYQPGLWHVQWDHEGTILSDQNDELLVIESVTTEDAGWYTATQISEDGKADPISASFYLTVYEEMPLRWGVVLAAFVCVVLVVAVRIGPVGRVGKKRQQRSGQ